MKTAPLAVILPCRNMGAYLGGALESAFRQDPAPAEVIVVDDASTDDSAAVARSFGPRVRLLKGAGQGCGVARNIAIHQTRQPLVGFLDADDLWLPGFLAAQCAKHESGDFVLTFTDWYRAADPALPGEARLLSRGSLVREGEVFAALLRENWIAVASVVARRGALMSAGLFDPELRGGEDAELWLRLARLGGFGWVREPLVFIREHRGSSTKSPEYPFFTLEKWRKILAVHQDVGAKERAIIDERHWESLYRVGRYALGLGDHIRGRRCFDEAVRRRPACLRARFWRLMSRLPEGLVSMAFSAKRRFSPIRQSS